jgi:polyphosphate kinase
MSVHEGKRIQDMTLIERLRNNLQPRGTAPLVRLRINGVGMFNKEFVDLCLDELERMPMRAAVGDGPTNLEKLAYQLLLDSAYIDLKQEAEREAWLKENT